MAGKRSSGEGYVKQLKSGTWHGELMDGYTEEGKRKMVSFSAGSKAEVVKKIREFQTQKESNIHIDREMTFSKWAEQWYADYKGQVQPSTYCNYKYTLKILNSFLGDKKLANILPMHINAIMVKLAVIYSNSQVKKCRTMLIQIFDAADANGLVTRNPARYANKLRNSPALDREDNSSKDAFSEEEIELLLEGLGNDLIGHSIRLMLGTGIRVQELLALTLKDIAEDGSTIDINKAVKTVDGKSTLGPTKSKRGVRIIPVPEEYRQYAVFVRTHGSTPFLWTASLKNPLYSVRSFRDKYNYAIEGVPGVRALTPHCTRHTYITRLQAKGVPMETIARLVGHSSIQTTDGYLHTSLETLGKAVSSLNDANPENVQAGNDEP